jgi:hypothetical protein
LICVRAHDDHEQYGGVLKLQVVAQHAAVLEELASGDVQLSAVTDLLDKPGELQKGALSTSWLAVDRVLVGDQLGQDTTYFPAAFGITTYARAASAVASVLTAVDTVDPDLAAPVAAELPSVPAGDPAAVLAALGDRIPGLTPDLQADVVYILENDPRPVAYIDTSKHATETITAGPIKIAGPVVEMRKHVRILRDADGWIVRVDSSREPRTTHP